MGREKADGETGDARKSHTAVGLPFRPTESDFCARKEVLAMYWHGIIALFSVVASLVS